MVVERLQEKTKSISKMLGNLQQYSDVLSEAKRCSQRCGGFRGGEDPGGCRLGRSKSEEAEWENDQEPRPLVRRESSPAKTCFDLTRKVPAENPHFTGVPLSSKMIEGVNTESSEC